MINDIFLSLALCAVFIIFGFPFVLLFTREDTIGQELRVVTMSCVLGIAISVIICSNVISFGGSLSAALMWCFLVWLFVVLMKGNLLFNCRYLKSVGFALLFVAGQSLLIGFTKPFDALFGVRIGVDAALYADGAQVILESTGQSGLEAMSSASPTSFGPAGLLVHLRWGTPMLMAMATRLFGLEHSYQIIMPLMAVMIGSTALLVVVLCKKLQLPNWVAVITGVMVMFNYPLLHLAIEGQRAQAMSIPIVIGIFLSWQCENERGIKLAIFNALLFCALVLFYGEYLPIMLAILVLAAIFEVGKKCFVRSLESLREIAIVIATTGIIIFPYTVKYLGHLTRLSLNVGYSTPHQVNGSEILGIGSIWTRWPDWITIGETPISIARQNTLRDWFLSLILLVLIRLGFHLLVRKARNWEFWFALMWVLIVLWLRFSYFSSQGYLWSKSATSMSPLLLVAVVYGVWNFLSVEGRLRFIKAF